MSRYDNDLLFESIQIREGIPQRLDLHQSRMDRSRESHFGSGPALDLASILEVPEDLRSGLVKCRVTYGELISTIEFTPYRRRSHRGVAIVADETIEYGFKYTDRSRFKALEQANPGSAVIIAQDGRLTDATYANIALYDGERWLTPARVLLRGVMREWLLERGTIAKADILLADLTKYSSIKLINAMLEWDESPVIPLHGEVA